MKQSKTKEIRLTKSALRLLKCFVDDPNHCGGWTKDRMYFKVPMGCLAVPAAASDVKKLIRKGHLELEVDGILPGENVNFIPLKLNPKQI